MAISKMTLAIELRDQLTPDQLEEVNEIDREIEEVLREYYIPGEPIEIPVSKMLSRAMLAELFFRYADWDIVAEECGGEWCGADELEHCTCEDPLMLKFS